MMNAYELVDEISRAAAKKTESAIQSGKVSREYSRSYEHGVFIGMMKLILSELDDEIIKGLQNLKY